LAISIIRGATHGCTAAVLSEIVFVLQNTRHQLCVMYGLLSRHNALVAGLAKIRTGTHWMLTVYIGVHKTNKK
jgi:hypothetical protein